MFCHFLDLFLRVFLSLEYAPSLFLVFPRLYFLSLWSSWLCGSLLTVDLLLFCLSRTVSDHFVESTGCLMHSLMCVWKRKAAAIHRKPSCAFSCDSSRVRPKRTIFSSGQLQLSELPSTRRGTALEPTSTSIRLPVTQARRLEERRRNDLGFLLLVDLVAWPTQLLCFSVVRNQLCTGGNGRGPRILSGSSE